MTYEDGRVVRPIPNDTKRNAELREEFRDTVRYGPKYREKLHAAIVDELGFDPYEEE
jgi:hypothetical protein